MIEALDAQLERSNTNNNIPAWMSSTIQSWWAGHVAHATNHCKAEEESYRPIMSERFVWPEDVGSLHKKLDSLRDKVGKAVDNLNADKSTLLSFRAVLSTYEKNMLEHFRVEETTALPLMRAYFTPEEISLVQKKVLEDAPENATGALIHTMGADRFKSEFMKERGIPFFVWHVAFKSRLSNYQSDMVSKVDAIKKGEEPVAKKTGWFT